MTLIRNVVQRLRADPSLNHGRIPLVSNARRRFSIASALLISGSVFAIDLFTDLDGAIAVLHVTAILTVAPLGRRYVVITGVITLILTIIAFAGGHIPNPSQGSLSRLTVSLVAITTTALLSLRDRSTRTTLTEQARILELTHDTVIIRDMNEVIVYWNDGAEKLYG